LNNFQALESITGRIKGRSSRWINQRTGKSGRLWQEESYDRKIRSERDLEETIDYIHNNPIRLGIVLSAEQYPWTSIRTIYSGGEKYRGWFEMPFRKTE
jgi:putative transposase